jgi:hypothetical protein
MDLRSASKIVQTSGKLTLIVGLSSLGVLILAAIVDVIS